MTYSFSDFSDVQEGDIPLEKGTYVVLTASFLTVPGSPAPLLSSSSTYIFFFCFSICLECSGILSKIMLPTKDTGVRCVCAGP